MQMQKVSFKQEQQLTSGAPAPGLSTILSLLEGTRKEDTEQNISW